MSAGPHTLAIAQTNADGGSSERRNALQVTGDLDLAALLLPDPLVLGPANQVDSKVQITWQPSDADDFREYKLYRRDSPGIDARTGELVFVSTVRGETSFTMPTCWRARPTITAFT